MHGNKEAQMRQGVIVFVVLLVLTLLEYWVAISSMYSLMLLAVTAGPKAILIIEFYMGFSRLGQTEDDGGHH